MTKDREKKIPLSRKISLSNCKYCLSPPKECSIDISFLYFSYIDCIKLIWYLTFLWGDMLSYLLYSGVVNRIIEGSTKSTLHFILQTKWVINVPLWFFFWYPIGSGDSEKHNSQDQTLILIKTIEQNDKEKEPNYLTISKAHLAHNRISNYIIMKSSVRKGPFRQ